MIKIKPVMRYHGAKYRLAPWVISFFPEHSTYVELFGGAAGVLIQKEKSKSEVYNDLDGDIVNVFRVLRSRDLSERLFEVLSLTPFSREDFEDARNIVGDPVERARRVLVRAHMGFGSAGATGHGTGFRRDSKRLGGNGSHVWAKYPDVVCELRERLRGVIIENRPAVDLIEVHDDQNTLFYVDPPYVHSTRSMGSKRGYYRYEMSDDDHELLLKALLEVKGFVVLSGYDTEMYNSWLSGWEKSSTSSRISSNRGCGVRTENVWLNPRCARFQKQHRLFGNGSLSI